jgi:DNA-binding response OmpR family regulator
LAAALLRVGMCQKDSHTILVVEDDPQIRSFLTTALHCEGYTVQEAEGGAAAIHTLDRAADSICLMVLDMSLPLVDGVHVLLHTRMHHSRLPVIAVSADSQSLADTKAAGARATLAKPFPVSDLLEIIESCQLGSGGASPA